MASRQVNASTGKVEQQALPPKDQAVSKDKETEPEHPLSSPTSNTPGKKIEDGKRERSPSSATAPSQKRPRMCPLPSPIADTIGENAAVGDSGEEIILAPRQVNPNTRKVEQQQALPPKDQAVSKDGNTKPEPPRSSLPIKIDEQVRKPEQTLKRTGQIIKPEQPLSTQAGRIDEQVRKLEQALKRTGQIIKPEQPWSTPERFRNALPKFNSPVKEIEAWKRKHLREDEPIIPSSATQKRPRTRHLQSPSPDIISEDAAVGDSRGEIIQFGDWSMELEWPEDYPEDYPLFPAAVGIQRSVEHWNNYKSWPRVYFEPERNMNPLLLARRRSSEDGPTAPSDQKWREAKHTYYEDPSYKDDLEKKGGFMGRCGMTAKSTRLCQTLLTAEQPVPQDTLFRDDLFEETCKSVRDREAMVVRDLSPLLCPSAQVLRIHGAKHLEILNETVHESWNRATGVHNFCGVYGPHPQPDYSVGFGRSAFTDDQLKKLKPFVGEATDTWESYFMATWHMYFPFLTCEARCGATGLALANRKSAHNMTLAVRGVVELFMLVDREQELDHEMLAFSISHDDHNVRIWGHYPIISEKRVQIFRHPVRRFTLESQEKWTAFKFTANVYETWMPAHLERICSAIDQLALNPNYAVSEASFPGESGLSSQEIIPDSQPSQEVIPTSQPSLDRQVEMALAEYEAGAAVRNHAGSTDKENESVEIR